MPNETLSDKDVLTARYVHIWLNTALTEMHQQNSNESFTVPAIVLGCREFIAEVLARVSAAHHSNSQADKAFAGFSKALERSIRRNIKLLREGKDGKDLSWLPGH